MTCMTTQPSIFRRDLLPPVLVVALYLLAAVWGALATGNGEFIFYIVVMLALLAGSAKPACPGATPRLGVAVDLRLCRHRPEGAERNH